MDTICHSGFDVEPRYHDNYTPKENVQGQLKIVHRVGFKDRIIFYFFVQMSFLLKANAVYLLVPSLRTNH